MTEKWTGKKLVPKGKEYLRKFPVDFDLITYGDTVPNSVIEEFYNVSQEDESFRFKQIQFLQLLDREKRIRGEVHTICVRDGIIKILTPEEAADYNRKRFVSHVSGLARSHEKNIHVEREYLTIDQQDKHDRTIMFQSKVLQSVMNVKKEFQIEAAGRKTPSFLDIKALDKVKCLDVEIVEEYNDNQED